MRGCALRKVVRNLAHKKLENRGVEPQHLPSQILLLFYLVCEERCTGIGGQATEGHNDGSCAALSDRTTMKTKQVFCTRHSDARVVTTTWMARTCWTSTKRMPRIKTPSTRSLGSRDELLQRKTCVRPCTQAMPFQAAGSVGNLHARSATYRTTELFPSRDFGKRVLIPRSLFHHMKALRRVCAHAQT